MINLFQIATQDQSISYLYQIFGGMNGIIPNIPLASGGTTPSASLVLLGTMFRTFNGVILAVGALTLVYMTIVGVMATAHEGEFMGKKWNNIWIPIRSVLGIALMVPTGSGYSGLQIIMMWVILQGVGAADTLWNTALNYVNLVGSPYAQTALPTVGAANAFTGIFQGLVCDASARVSKADPTNSTNGGYFCYNSSDPFCSSSSPTINANATSLNLGPGGSCGTINYNTITSNNTTQNCSAACGSNPNGISCLSCQAQVTALQAVIPTLAGIAEQMVNADYSYRDFYTNSSTKSKNPSWQWIYSYCSAQTPAIPQNQCCIGGAGSPACQAGSGGTSFPDVNSSGKTQNASPDAVSKVYWAYWPQLGPNLGASANFVNTAVNYYMLQAQTAFNTWVQAQGQNNVNTTEAGIGGYTINAANGWIYAGGYYYLLANMTKGSVSAALPNLGFTPPANISSSSMGNYRNNFDAASSLVSAASNASSSTPTTSTPSTSTPSNPISSGLSAPVTNAVASMTSTLQSSVSNTTNPLFGIQVAGAALLWAADVTFGILVAVIIGLGIAGDIDVFIMGNGIINPVGPTDGLVLMFIVPGIYALLAIMISLGGLLSVYVPLIPYLVFTFGAIGWIISVIEAMVAGPLVALGILSPSGEHELLGKSAAALMLIFSIFLRPSLMIFGLMAAMLLANVVLIMINALFFPIVMNNLAGIGGSGTDPIGAVLFLCAYVMLIVAALNKCFALINVLPAQVMRWIGHHGEAAVEPPLQEIKGGIEAGGGRAAGALEGGIAGTKGVSGAVEGGKQAYADKKAQSQPIITPKKQ